MKTLSLKHWVLLSIWSDRSIEALIQVLGLWIARKPPGFGFVLMGSHRLGKRSTHVLYRVQHYTTVLFRDAKDACEGLNNSKIGPYRWLFCSNISQTPMKNPAPRMQVEMATNDMKGKKPSSYIDTSRSRGGASRCDLIFWWHTLRINIQEGLMNGLIQVEKFFLRKLVQAQKQE